MPEGLSRQFILEEIRRVAGELGRAPGKAQFRAETGIREADWSGKFWARWSDALQEAGLEPNQLNAAFSDEHLLEKVAHLTHELQRFPTIAEMLLKRRRDRSFPNEKTFRRLGSRAALAARVRQWCDGRDGYEDVSEACSAVPQRPQEPDGGGSAIAEFGYVYLLRSGRFYKIGRSNSAGRREYELAIQLPEKVQRIHVIRTDDPAGIERYWHQRFESKRKNGEWFDLDAEDVRTFRRRKFM